MRYEEMLAGKEMDVLVAEKVMGMRSAGDDPDFSTDIAAAWQVVDHLDRKGWGFELDNQFEYAINYQETAPEHWLVRFTNLDTDVENRADSVPLAICRAALAAGDLSVQGGVWCGR